MTIRNFKFEVIHGSSWLGPHTNIQVEVLGPLEGHETRAHTFYCLHLTPDTLLHIATGVGKPLGLDEKETSQFTHWLASQCEESTKKG